MDQVHASASLDGRMNVKKDQGFPRIEGQPPGAPCSIKVKRSPHLTRAKRKDNRHKKGGWRKAAGLTLGKVREALNVDRIARTIFNAERRRIVITVNPAAIDGESDSARKRRITRIVSSRFPEALRRAGQSEWIAWTVWQHPLEGRLHCHTVAWVEPEYDDVLARMCDGSDIHAKPWDDDVSYILRQRLPDHPERENKKKWTRKPGNPIKGAILSISQALKDRITLWEADLAHKPKQAPLRFRESLFDDLPAIPPPAFDLATERKRRGLSQAALADMIGLKQPHLANVERGHDSLSSARLRAIRYVLDGLPLAV
jgi:Helix-turn-helix